MPKVTTTILVGRARHHCSLKRTRREKAAASSSFREKIPLFLLFSDVVIGNIAAPWFRVPPRMQSRNIALLNRMWYLVTGTAPRSEKEFGELLKTYFPSPRIQRFPLAIRKEDQAEEIQTSSRRKQAERDLQSANANLSLSCAMKWAVGHTNFLAHRKAALVIAHASLSSSAVDFSAHYRTRGLSWGSAGDAPSASSSSAIQNSDLMSLREELENMASRYDRLRRKYLQKEHECEKLMRNLRRISRLNANKPAGGIAAKRPAPAVSPPVSLFTHRQIVHLKSPLFKQLAPIASSISEKVEEREAPVEDVFL